MNISEQEFKFMTESITSDLVQLLIDRNQYSLPDAVKAVYSSHIYDALLRPTSKLYTQSSGYVYNYLIKEIKREG